MTYRYQVHGLFVSSEIPLDDLIPATPDTHIDVIIRLGPTPMNIDQPLRQGDLYQTKPGTFLLSMDGIARYLVTEGKKIVITPAPNHDPADLRLFLYTTPFAALLRQRETCVLHASAVTKDGNALLISGASSSGKSSITAAFVGRGYQVLCDEIAAISEDPASEFWVQPGIPRIQLWPKAAEELAINVINPSQVRRGIQKIVFSVENSFSTEPSHLKTIIVLSRGGVSQHEIRELKGQEKFRAFLHATYLTRLIIGMDAKSYFSVSNRIWSKVRIFSFTFPDKGFSIHEAADKIEKEALQWGE